ncbi:MAG: ribonuclease PH [Myxococcales bacterium]|nr:ribonuclease PH [Myxococcales bacterium]
MASPRPDGRAPGALRPVEFQTGLQRDAAGSVLVRWGHTHVLCAATLDEKVPAHRQGSGGGWLTAEYAMLPAATRGRYRRERQKIAGRTAEIQRLIGRSLRAAIDLDRIGSRTMWIDCDVMQADGGTRCASITGGWVAAALAAREAARADAVKFILPPQVAAVSVGVVDGRVVTDLDYREDSAAEVDLNYVARPDGLVEIQGTAEGKVFSHDQLLEMVEHADAACQVLFALQREALAAAGVNA